MKTDFKKMYIDWLHKNIDQDQIRDDIFRITFPYLNRNNDCIEIYIQVLDDKNYRITDDAETINELSFSGLNIFSSPKRENIFNIILDSHGISLSEKNELFVICAKNELPFKKHMLTQCMIKISDMFYLAKPHTQSLFIEDVTRFFDVNSIYVLPNVSFTGKSGLNTTYDFALPRTKHAPERLIKAVNNLDVTQAGYITFLWEDTKQKRDSNSTLYVFVQDKNRRISTNAITAMTNYGIKTVLWSDRDSVVKELRA